ncbi:MAG: DUF4091 domain-containing protein [Clostridia bacterium]|nr:DUF4091 domain-containing protein [Clostridia bacterium]
MIKCKFAFCSSLEKVFFDMPNTAFESGKSAMFKNEIFSFQIVGKLFDGGGLKKSFKIECESDINDYINIYGVDYVPSMLPSHSSWDCDCRYITTTPGLFPDPLKRLCDNEFYITDGRVKALWISVEPNGKISGTYPIGFKIYYDGEVIDELVYTVDIKDALLPDLKLINTGWFHGDCLAALHNVDIMSDEYFEIAEKYIKVYTKFGHNMILTPVFTPPLDTAVGTERPTNQLVDVTLKNGKYSFGFKNLKRWIEMCLRCGIKYFEISHLFTQWGATSAPKVMATADGEYKRIFGWETDAASEEYTEFLNAFLPELKKVFDEYGLFDKCWFHVSDEPHAEHIENYKAARKTLKKYIPDDRLIDALANYEYYKEGIITKPIPSTSVIQTFMDNGVKNLWTYYCCGQGNGYLSNRFMAMPSYRNRILGYQLYKNDIEGFLQWGFNFWFTQYSLRVADPYKETDADGAFQSGDAFIVYPMDDNGEVVCSLRLYVFNESMQDLRAMQLLESLTDRETVMSLLCRIRGFDTYPGCADYILDLRSKINDMIFEKMNLNN